MKARRLRGRETRYQEIVQRHKKKQTRFRAQAFSFNSGFLKATNDASFLQQIMFLVQGWGVSKADTATRRQHHTRGCTTTQSSGKGYLPAAWCYLQESCFWKWKSTPYSFYPTLSPTTALHLLYRHGKKEAGLSPLTQHCRGMCKQRTLSCPGKDCTCIQGPRGSLGSELHDLPPSLPPGHGFLPNYCLRWMKQDGRMLQGTDP